MPAVMTEWLRQDQRHVACVHRFDDSRHILGGRYMVDNEYGSRTFPLFRTMDTALKKLLMRIYQV